MDVPDLVSNPPDAMGRKLLGGHQALPPWALRGEGLDHVLSALIIVSGRWAGGGYRCHSRSLHIEAVDQARVALILPVLSIGAVTPQCGFQRQSKHEMPT